MDSQDVRAVGTGEIRASATIVPIADTFGLLPEPVGRLRSFLGSLALNIAIGLLLFWFTITQLHKAPVFPRYVSTELIFPRKLPPLHKIPRLKTPPPPVAELPRRIETERPRPQPAKPEVVRLQTSAMPAMPSAPATIVVAPAQPKVGSFASAKPSAVANNDRAPAIKTGGFGDPSGVAANANATRPATIAAIGKFENAPGTGQGAGAAHAGLVTTGGFGSAVAKGAGGAVGETGMGGGTIATGGFGGNRTSNSAAPEPRIQQVHFTPPEVLSEPRPQYTQEARQLRIQGEITLQVRFGVDGRVEVLRIVSGLGHGLDQEAALVAEQIRFKPAVKDGQPTDHITYIHILFQLA
jgi:TonB family protein